MAPRLPRAVVERGDRLVLKPALHAPVPLSRRLLELLKHANPPPRDVAIRPHALDGSEGELHVPDGAEETVRLLYLHGGGFRTGSPATQRALTAHLARAAGVAAFSARYRLAPEHPCPAGVEDAVAAYGALAEQAGDGVVVAGDSAGAALALAAAIRIRDGGGIAPPHGLALISPWVDLALTGESYERNARTEAVLTTRLLAGMARDYCGGCAPDEPLCSPLRADLAGLPPMLVHSGTHDLLLSDCESLVERARAAGGDAELRLFDRMWHDFHVHAGGLAEADEAVAELGAWIAGRLGSDSV